MLPMPAVLDRPTPCRVHRFSGQVPQVVIGGEFCEQGHLHQTDRWLYRCTGCGFLLTLPRVNA